MSQRHSSLFFPPFHNTLHFYTVVLANFTLHHDVILYRCFGSLYPPFLPINSNTVVPTLCLVLPLFPQQHPHLYRCLALAFHKSSCVLVLFASSITRSCAAFAWPTSAACMYSLSTHQHPLPSAWEAECCIGSCSSVFVPSLKPSNRATPSNETASNR